MKTNIPLPDSGLIVEAVREIAKNNPLRRGDIVREALDSLGVEITFEEYDLETIGAVLPQNASREDVSWLSMVEISCDFGRDYLGAVIIADSMRKKDG